MRADVDIELKENFTKFGSTYLDHNHTEFSTFPQVVLASILPDTPSLEDSTSQTQHLRYQTHIETPQVWLLRF